MKAAVVANLIVAVVVHSVVEVEGREQLRVATRNVVMLHHHRFLDRFQLLQRVVVLGRNQILSHRTPVELFAHNLRQLQAGARIEGLLGGGGGSDVSRRVNLPYFCALPSSCGRSPALSTRVRPCPCQPTRCPSGLFLVARLHVFVHSRQGCVGIALRVLRLRMPPLRLAMAADALRRIARPVDALGIAQLLVDRRKRHLDIFGALGFNWGSRSSAPGLRWQSPAIPRLAMAEFPTHSNFRLKIQNSVSSFACGPNLPHTFREPPPPAWPPRTCAAPRSAPTR